MFPLFSSHLRFHPIPILSHPRFIPSSFRPNPPCLSTTKPPPLNSLKMNFVNVGYPTAALSTPFPQSQSQSLQSQSSLNNGSAPVLASCFSDVFQVFSAKKFPGVIESTALSKIFATQGIKIPIRKDGPRGNVRVGGEEDDE